MEVRVLGVAGCRHYRNALALAPRAFPGATVVPGECADWPAFRAAVARLAPGAAHRTSPAVLVGSGGRWQLVGGADALRRLVIPCKTASTARCGK